MCFNKRLLIEKKNILHFKVEDLFPANIPQEHIKFFTGRKNLTE